MAGSDTRLRLVSDSDANLRAVIATLEENRAWLVESGNPEAAQILAVAILQLRMRLHGIGNAELEALCEAMQLRQANRTRKAADHASKDERYPRWPSSFK